jgi:oxygen-independent coproporphyrinogen-3 oxidase
MNAGVDLDGVKSQFGEESLERVNHVVQEQVQDGLLERDGKRIRLTQKGRLLSNEVFQSFLARVEMA